MQTADYIVSTLKEQGFRMTPVRKALIDILCTTTLPLSIQELLEVLGARVRQVNKTTAYREVEFLMTQGFIQEVQLGDRARYELVGHHHHLLCQRCRTVQCVEAPELEQALLTWQEQAGPVYGFSDIAPSITLTGVCNDCRS